MRLFFVAASVSLVLVAATFACSSSAPDATAAPDAGKKDSAPVTETPPVEETPPVTEPPPDETDGGTDEAGTPGDGGSSGTVGTTGDAGSLCDGTSFREAEPNPEATPNALNTPPKTFSFCGQVKQGDEDVWTFTTPPFDNNFTVNPAGNVRIQGTVGAKTFDSQNGGLNFGNIDDGAKWVVKISTGNANVRDYRINFIFN